MIIFPHMTNLVDLPTTTITGNTPAIPVGFEAVNVADPDLSLSWRNTTVGTQNRIVFDLGSAKPVRAFGIIGSNDAGTGTGLKIQGDDEGAFLSPPVDSGFFHPLGSNVVDSGDWPFLKNGFFDFGSDKVFQFWRVEINDPTNPDGFHQIRRILFGQVFDPTGDYSVINGYNIGIEDTSSVITMRSGDTVNLNGVRRRTHKFMLDQLPQLEFQQYMDFAARRGLGGDFCVLGDEDRDEDTWAFEGFYGRFNSMPEYEYWLSTFPRTTTSRRYYRVNSDLIERTTG